MAGNGLVEAGTFVGILLGTVAGGALILLPGGAWPFRVLLGRVGVRDPERVQHPASAGGAAGLTAGLEYLRENVDTPAPGLPETPVWFAILGISWFWAVGATLLAAFPTLAREACMPMAMW